MKPTAEDHLYLEATVLREALATIHPDQPRFLGRVFLERLLDTKGPDGVAQFLHKAQQAIEEQRAIPLDKVEAELLNRTYLNLINRRVALEMFRGAITATWIGFGAFGAAEQVWRKAHHMPSPKRDTTNDTPFTGMKNTFDAVLPWAIMGWAADAIPAARERWKGMKLGEVAEAVEALGQSLKREQQEQKARAR